MKTNQKLSLMAWLYKAKASKKTGMAPLYMRITINGNFKDVSLDKKVNPDNWDTEQKKDTGGGDDADDTNDKILEATVDIKRLLKQLLLQHDVVTAAMLKNAYIGNDPMQTANGVVVEDGVSNATLMESYDKVIERFKKQVKAGTRSDGTRKHWDSRKLKIKEFLLFQYKQEDIKLNDIKYRFASEFFDYLTLEGSKPLKEITAKGHVQKLSQLLDDAAKFDLIVKNPIKGYTIVAHEPEVQPLEFYQVEAIYYKKISIQRLDEIRDTFIVQCFTGFSFIDLEALSSKHIIKVGIEGELWFTNPRGKTDVQESVPILPIVLQIIEKYKNHPDCLKNDRLFPVKTNTKYNAYLKELADICEIDRVLKTHLARHTFADLMLANDFPLEDVQKMLGHKSIRTTQRYARVRKERISRNMKKVRTALFTASGKLKKVA